MFASLVPALIEAVLGRGARGGLVGVGAAVLEAAVPLVLRPLVAILSGMADGAALRAHAVPL